ncbi:MAG TPA: diacylglycerol kinase family protein [Thermomicrobiales bacterium]|nr:diacylglycerol kinase family protein [Thermomicrobiales bacterium]
MRKVNETEAAPPARRVRVLLNANAGRKAGIPTNNPSPELVREAMARHGLGAELIVTESEAEAIDATRDAVARGYDIVVAAGGDGTIDTIASALLYEPTALGIIPLGSVMNVARMLEISRDLDAAMAIVAAGAIRRIDVGEANGVLFLEGGSVGFNAAIFHETQHIEEGDFRSLFGAARVLLGYKPPRMIIALDDRVVTTRALAVAVANGPYTGLGFTVAPEADLSDGKFDVVVYSGFSRLELIRHFGGIAFGRRRASSQATTYRSAWARIEGRHPLPCHADAHDLGSTPVEYRVLPGALWVVAPGGALTPATAVGAGAEAPGAALPSP